MKTYTLINQRGLVEEVNAMSMPSSFKQAIEICRERGDNFQVNEYTHGTRFTCLLEVVGGEVDEIVEEW